MIGSTDFTFGIINDPALLEEAFKLRFQVYCRECNFINEVDYPDRTEKDKFDPLSIHFFANDPEGIVGTARLVLDSPLGFPLEEHCKDCEFEKDIPKKHCAEISRLVISKHYRRRKNDGMYYSPDYADNPAAKAMAEKENLVKRIKPMTFGLFKEMYQASKRRDIRCWYVVMEKSLYLLLKIHGFEFKPIGKETDYYGPVRPYSARLEDLEKSVYHKLPNLFNEFTQDLEPKYRPIMR